MVCGRRRERFPDRSIYNRLCDIEWDTPIGRANACGGDAMIRADAFAQVDGYRADLIAGEEPELCLRLRDSRLANLAIGPGNDRPRRRYDTFQPMVASDRPQRLRICASIVSSRKNA